MAFTTLQHQIIKMNIEIPVIFNIQKEAQAVRTDPEGVVHLLLRKSGSQVCLKTHAQMDLGDFCNMSCAQAAFWESLVHATVSHGTELQ